MGNHALVVDPGDATPVREWLGRNALQLCAILITHHHADHTGGLGELCQTYPDIPVYGPRDQAISGVNRQVAEGDQIALPELGMRFDVLSVPGHTATHIAYLAGDMLFPGDTLFSAGCGRLLGGTAEQLHASLQRLASLPDSTRVFCTHEYTLSNLAFASAAEPHNSARDEWLETCKALRSRGHPTLPSTIEREKKINPFLRTDQPGIFAAVKTHTGYSPVNAQACFTALRAWKDGF